MPFFLEIPDVNANVNLTSFQPGVPSDYIRHLRTYCWVLEGTILEEKEIAIREPKLAQAFAFSPVYRGGYFEVTGPVRVISIKEYVHLYDESRRQRGLAPFHWDASVYRCIRDLDEDDARRKTK